MQDEINKILMDFKGGFIVLGDARRRILRLILKEVKGLFQKEEEN